MVEESNYCTDLLKKYFDKKFRMTKKDDEQFENSNVGFMIMIMLVLMLK